RAVALPRRLHSRPFLQVGMSLTPCPNFRDHLSGVGDEFPIQAFANRGYFVLSVENHSYEAVVGTKVAPSSITRAFNTDFAGRKSLLSSIETMVRSLVSRGLIDNRRIGITGLSDGSSTVQFASLNSSLFSAGSATACCWEHTQNALLGPTAARGFERNGWPRQIDANPRFWSQISIAQNPARVSFPLLFQASDDEYIAVLESYNALVEAGRPVDLYIFPGEHHIKWQPAHRLAVYERNIAWFDFWLLDRMPTTESGILEAMRWKAMRDRAVSNKDKPIGVATQPPP
ncbi:prolyl oligopeptidase family serine peptidase, partial [Sphingobium olei]